MEQKAVSGLFSEQFFLGLPARKPIGIYPTLWVILINTIIFLTAFSNYFSNYSLLVTQNVVLPLDVCDKIIYLSMPALILQGFIFSTIRQRMNYKPLNLWSIIHTVLLALNVLQYFIYIIERPYGCFSLVTNMFPLEGIADKAAKFLDTLGRSNMNIYDAYNVQDTPSHTFVMIFASYLYIFYVLYIVIFLSVTCDMFCSEQFIITLRRDQNTYVGTAVRAPEKAKKAAIRAKKEQMKQRKNV